MTPPIRLSLTALDCRDCSGRGGIAVRDTLSSDGTREYVCPTCEGSGRARCDGCAERAATTETPHGAMCDQCRGRVRG